MNQVVIVLLLQTSAIFKVLSLSHEINFTEFYPIFISLFTSILQVWVCPNLTLSLLDFSGAARNVDLFRRSVSSFLRPETTILQFPGKPEIFDHTFLAESTARFMMEARCIFS